MKKPILNDSLFNSKPSRALAAVLLFLLLALAGTAQAAVSIAGTFGPSGWRGLNTANTMGQPTFTAGTAGCWS